VRRAMATTSPFYFSAAAHGSKMIQGIPMFAVTIGASYAQGWQSGEISNFGGFKAMMDRVNVQVPVYLAMPRLYAESTFKVGQEYDKVSVIAFRPINSSDYMSGATITLVLNQIKVVSAAAIFQWKGLPIPPQVQKNYLEKKIGRETYIPTAVALEVLGVAEAIQ